MATGTLRTKRLVLRPWRDADRSPFAAMNRDCAVMEFLYPSVLSRRDSDVLLERFEAERKQYGFCPWAVGVVGGAPFIGFVGLHRLPPYLAAAPTIEVGWRLGRSAWGRGYATEAAQAALHYGFETLGVDEVVSLTAVINERSRRVMERLGMTRRAADDFEHPKLPPGHRLRPHVLYRLAITQWAAAR